MHFVSVHVKHWYSLSKWKDTKFYLTRYIHFVIEEDLNAKKK